MIFDYDNVSFYYEILGDGKSLCLLHGNSEDHTYFKEQVPFFVQRGYQCIVMDMRSHGQSTRGDKSLNFEVFASDVKALLVFLQIDKASLLGFSDGANTVMQFALSYPQMVEAIILNSGNLSFKGMSTSCQISIISSYYCLLFMAMFIRSLKDKVQVISLMLKYPKITLQQLQTLHVAALVIVGENDMIKHNHSLSIYQSIKDAKFIEITGADHFAARKKANIFNAEVYQFLKEKAHGR